MEVDLKIYSNLSKKQYGFKRGSYTIAAVHKLVKKFEFAILNQGMALGTFLDIEGAFGNVSFDNIERALDSKFKSAEVNQWIRSMIHKSQPADNRRTAGRAKDHSDHKRLSAGRDYLSFPVEPRCQRVT